MTSSIALTPLAGGGAKIFLASQLCSTPLMPPKDLSLAGHTAIISGANGGLGLTCAEMLLDHHVSRLIIAVRSIGKGEAAAETLKKKHPAANIEVWALDMMSYKSIQAFADRCSTLSRIDIVILNAGMVTGTFSLSPHGHEEMVQVNYLSTTLLTVLLLPILKSKKTAGKASRLTVVSSGSTFGAKFLEHDKVPLIAGMDDNTTFDPMDRYQTSKLLGQLTITKLASYVPKEDVILNIVDPGLTKGSGLHQHLSRAQQAFMGTVKALTARSLKEGASTYIDAAVLKGDETHGSYLMDWKIHPFPAFVYTPEGRACAARLWDETLQELDFAGARSILQSMQSGRR
ncbi:short chain dehydrogenase [Colletotrichum graminicola]|uniref:Short chain dehydrogenase n=1 Tax=Colletotrichum graminicola (strain M1.001 / M2 / FGSC 10212) TaxID=645133 RepID=E3QQF8_COLGM|nr:short chain dehydrogenase [Colletotrichum graminicola M1.001]EFQ33096.1 short chain dehydrogenase [Colletotrichum graminicola M1.001]WDK21968.1 short chain dehydrogenase [Colletotrichum graminicola]